MTAFNIPMNLPHAGTIAGRIEYQVRSATMRLTDEHRVLLGRIESLMELLGPIREAGDNPPRDEALEVAAKAADLGRKIVDDVERLGLGGDRLGQCVRNLFECLELGEEGAQISLRAGENPDSALRP